MQICEEDLLYALSKAEQFEISHLCSDVQKNQTIRGESEPVKI